MADVGSDTILSALYDRSMEVSYVTHYVLVAIWYTVNQLSIVGVLPYRNGISWFLTGMMALNMLTAYSSRYRLYKSYQRVSPTLRVLTDGAAQTRR
jgi:hypothetical protein